MKISNKTLKLLIIEALVCKLRYIKLEIIRISNDT